MKKVIWINVVTRPQTGLTPDFVLTGLDKEFRKIFGISYDTGFFHRGNFGTVIESKEGRQKLARLIIKRYKEDRFFFEKHLKAGRVAMNNLAKVSRSLSVSPKSSNRQLLRLFRLYKRAFYRFTPFLYSVFPIETALTKELKDKVDSKEEYFRILTTVRKDSDFYLEQKDLLEILIDKKNGKNIKEALESHANLFGYMGLTNDFKSEPWNVKQFRGFFKNFKDPKLDLEKLVAGRKKELEIYINFIKTLPRDVVETAEILQECMSFRNERISSLKIGQNRLKPVLLEIARRFNIPFADIIWYRVEEIENLLLFGRVADVSARKKSWRVELVGGEVRYIENEIIKNVKRKRITQIKGSVASVGKAEGTVRVVFSSKELDKVKKGDILVTSMTTPDYVLGMRRSAAIITDEGGILSHAAIVSREFGIPCITGTQIATQVLKDGDKVLVDAEKGVVTILD